MGDNYDAPIKVMIEDLSRFSKIPEGWTYKLDDTSDVSVIGNKVMIQGVICKTAGFSNEILILFDETSKVKITRGDQVPGDFSWLKTGLHCNVIGCLLNNGKLPHVSAVKIAKVSNDILKDMWLLEVMELKNILLNKISTAEPSDFTKTPMSGKKRKLDISTSLSDISEELDLKSINSECARLLNISHLLNMIFQHNEFIETKSTILEDDMSYELRIKVKKPNLRFKRRLLSESTEEFFLSKPQSKDSFERTPYETDTIIM